MGGSSDITFFLFCEPRAHLTFFDINNDPPSSKFEKCVMRNKESSLLGLISVGAYYLY